ncbi:hypothetical protein GF324_10240 [bacterium]|nr:hypothetical protein [bacterium]
MVAMRGDHCIRVSGGSDTLAQHPMKIQLKAAGTSGRILVQDCLVWADDHEEQWLPLGIELSRKIVLGMPSSGEPSMPIRPLRLCNLQMNFRIRRLMPVLHYRTEPDLTEFPRLGLQLFGMGKPLTRNLLPLSESTHGRNGSLYARMLPVKQPFLLRSADTLVIMLLDGDDIHPVSFFLFGMDGSKGRPKQWYPLIYLPEWDEGSLNAHGGRIHLATESPTHPAFF